jgi:hypothetical protein
MVPGSPALDGHPKNVYLPEAAVLEQLNAWLGELFARKNRDGTVVALVASQGAARSDSREAPKKRLDAAESRLRRLQAAIEAGVDPAALVEGINDAQAQRPGPSWRWLRRRPHWTWLRFTP